MLAVLQAALERQLQDTGASSWRTQPCRMKATLPLLPKALQIWDHLHLLTRWRAPGLAKPHCHGLESSARIPGAGFMHLPLPCTLRTTVSTPTAGCHPSPHPSPAALLRGEREVRPS